jgi:chemotaxis protein methyltransferase CheR
MRGNSVKNLTDAEFRQIRDYIKANYGISLSDEKKTLVHSRLRSTLEELDMETFSEYFDYLMRDRSGDALNKFVNKITTNHTFFMREPDHFDYFTANALPYIYDTYSRARDIRLWCAPCSSGEESVTLQILLQEFFKKHGGWDTQILATDISENVLDKAVHGVYAAEALKAVPKHWLTEYFSKVDSDFYKVKENVMKNIIYRKFNLMHPLQFKKKFQVIFCRNVMIYFDSDTRNALVKRFFDVMDEGGYLFIGHSESISNSGSGFQYIKPAVYRKPPF